MCHAVTVSWFTFDRNCPRFMIVVWSDANFRTISSGDESWILRPASIKGLSLFWSKPIYGRNTAPHGTLSLQIRLALCCLHSELGYDHISNCHDVCPQCSLNQSSTLMRTAFQAWLTERWWASDLWLLVVVQANGGVGCYITRSNFVKSRKAIRCPRADSIRPSH